ncbi:hypothetical protein KY289_019631 [Solanum tuberosum]|nr:hypothetical protein KY289_019631 [Solanum tuberosum]
MEIDTTIWLHYQRDSDILNQNGREHRSKSRVNGEEAEPRKLHRNGGTETEREEERQLHYHNKILTSFTSGEHKKKNLYRFSLEKDRNRTKSKFPTHTFQNRSKVFLGTRFSPKSPKFRTRQQGWNELVRAGAVASFRGFRHLITVVLTLGTSGDAAASCHLPVAVDAGHVWRRVHVLVKEKEDAGVVRLLLLLSASMREKEEETMWGRFLFGLLYVLLL